MDWNCTLTEERLSDVLDRSLTLEDMAAFSAHAASCARCSELVSQVGQLVTRIHQLPAVEEPPFLASRIVAATRGTQAKDRSAKSWLGWLQLLWQPRFAVGALTVAASVFIVLHAVSLTARRSALNPMNLYHSANRHAHLTYARGVKFVNDLRVVYVIQSRLSSEPRPASQPAAPFNEPAPQPDRQRPDSDAKPNSQPVPQTGRHSLDSVTELAVLMVSTGSHGFSQEASRSLP